ncbi:uncharacterized protein LOC142224880 [Haematobia irritans]|uniref:uncharacterized protein LOC142224880 n=1 Tax=Haematobia irritans TaxID=7368 RepID=UPI003F4FCDAE
MERIAMEPNELIRLIKDTINTNLDEKLKSLPSKADLEDVKNEITAVNTEIQQLRNENVILKEELMKFKKENNDYKRDIMWLQKQIKSNKLFIKGLSQSKNPIEEVNKVFKQQLNIEPNIKTVTKIFDRNGKMAVLVELENEIQIQEVFKHTKKLAGTTISIERDMMPMKQDHKNAFLGLKRKILAITNKHKIVVREDKMKVGDSWFKWGFGNVLECGKSDGIKELVKLYGDELKDINVNFDDLRSYQKSKN